MRRAIIVAAFAALGFCALAAAGPRKIDDCEAIKDPNAYNLCLASFGPVRGQHSATYPGVAAEGEKGLEKGAEKGAVFAPSGRSRHGGGRGNWRGRYGGYATHGARTANGRVRMEFSPGR